MADDYAYYLYVRDLPELFAAKHSLENRLRVEGDLAGAQIVRAAYDKLLTELKVLSFEISSLGTDLLRKSEKATRVRPDSIGAREEPRLGDTLFADPLTQLLPGSVGIANETTLDETLPWWPTNEEGSSGRVGAKLYGVYEPGGSIPSKAMSREHPIFQVEDSETGEGGWMTVTKPIPARRFILRSIPEIEAAWIKGFDAIKDTFIAEVATASAVG
jgi:hypothetical protein